MHSAQLVLNAQWRAIPHEALLSFRSLGYRSHIAGIRKTREAAMLHQAINDTLVQSTWLQYDAMLATDGIALAAMGGGVVALLWHCQRSCTWQMRARYIQGIGYGQVSVDIHTRHRDVLQRLRDSIVVRHDRGLRALRHRASEWVSNVPETLAGAFLRFSKIRPLVEDIFACLHSLCNALCTTACFGTAVIACLFRRGSPGADCPVFRRWVGLHLDSPLSSASFVAQFLPGVSPR